LSRPQTSVVARIGTILGAGAGILAASAGAAASQDAHFEEKVEVSRVLMDVRAVDGRGNPIRGLEAADFRVRVDGRLARVDGVRWVSGTTPYSEGLDPAAARAAETRPGPAGRRLVFLFQKDFGSSSYLLGLLRMKNEALKLLETLKPQDEVAVLSFDSHLKLWVDFTTDHARLRKAIDHSILFEEEPAALPALEADSLATHLDYGAAKDAATPESALLVLAEALEPLPGSKSLAFFGAWMGHMSGGAVRMGADYGEARSRLAAARVVVFALDVTDADAHSLDVGLQQVAEDTGGFYARTRDFPKIAMDRLERALAGYYVLSFEGPRLGAGAHTVKIDLVRRKGDVFTSGRYVESF
jgi:VWFA-related protein